VGLLWIDDCFRLIVAVRFGFPVSLFPFRCVTLHARNAQTTLSHASACIYPRSLAFTFFRLRTAETLCIFARNVRTLTTSHSYNIMRSLMLIHMHPLVRCFQRHTQHHTNSTENGMYVVTHTTSHTTPYTAPHTTPHTSIGGGGPF
jgi:hypothetical protein